MDLINRALRSEIYRTPHAHEWERPRTGDLAEIKRDHCQSESGLLVQVMGDPHLMVAARYVDLNPVAAGFVERPEDWGWSSYRAHVGLERPMDLLANDAFLEYVGATRERAINTYRAFVELGLGV